MHPIPYGIGCILLFVRGEKLDKVFDVAVIFFFGIISVHGILLVKIGDVQITNCRHKLLSDHFF